MLGQYIIVAIIVAAAIFFLIRFIIKRINKIKKDKACDDCALKDACEKKVES